MASFNLNYLPIGLISVHTVILGGSAFSIWIEGDTNIQFIIFSFMKYLLTYFISISICIVKCFCVDLKKLFICLNMSSILAWHCKYLLPFCGLPFQQQKKSFYEKFSILMKQFINYFFFFLISIFNGFQETIAYSKIMMMFSHNIF